MVTKASHEDHINLRLSYDSGLISICETNWLTPNKVRKLEITTSTHYIEIDYQSQSMNYSSLSTLMLITLLNRDYQVPIDKEEPIKVRAD